MSSIDTSPRRVHIHEDNRQTSFNSSYNFIESLRRGKMYVFIISLVILLNIAGLRSLKWSNDTQSSGSERYHAALSIRNVSYPSNIRRIRDKAPETNSNGLVGKIDVLSRLLRVHIDDFRDETDRAEIVFLVDASSSVGQENFKSELNFVRRLLSDLTVDESATRVAVVTFAGKGLISRNIDQISSSQMTGNKCTLLNEELSNIIWTGGGTYTRGALLEALTILRRSRTDARKVVFLITDGFSNGGDPRSVAKLLKELGAMILTFGIRTGNVQELHDVASEPGYTHSYLLDSFVEFEAIARRALHRDLKPGKYILTASRTSCDVLCDLPKAKDESACCDDLAECSCGTTSGHYACLCLVGYFGSGLKGSCHPCPNGTYGITQVQAQDSCLPCPSPNHVTLKIPATSLSDCICASGFLTINSSSCEAITCPKLRVPENGYLVKANACSNVVNAACGLRCRIGFRLVGDSIRLCSKSGFWSGTETQCLLKTCPALRAPTHGRVHCEHDDEYQQFKTIKPIDSSALPIDAKCQFKCDLGYQLLGSKVRNCLPVSRWDGLKVSCKQIKCEPLARMANGLISPETCTGTKKLMFGTNCSIVCSPGFDLQGPSSRRCIGSSGLWSQRYTASRCIDKTAPEIKCPDDKTWMTLPKKRYALVNWTLPVAKDNSDKQPHVWSKPHLTFPWKAKIGTHLITYLAQDVSGNRARCRFVVKIIDDEPPIVENCEDPPIFLTTDGNGAHNVTWDEPVFHDNSGKKLIVKTSHQQGDFFPLGTTPVIYNVTDRSNNIATCVINIKVQDACKDVPVVANGAVNCRGLGNQDVRCVITCNDGYVLPIEQDGAEDNVVLACNALENGWNQSFLPDCSVTQVPESVNFGGRIVLESNTSICQESMTLEYLQTQIHKDLTKNFGEACHDNGIDCRLSNIYLDCQENEILTLDRQRRGEPLKPKKKTRVKRKRDRIEIKFRFIGRIIAEYRHDPQQAIQKLRQEIQSLTKAGTLNLLNEKTNREIANLALNLRTILKEDVKGLCERGRILKQDKCVRCPAGTFHNSETNRNHCISCLLGEYQDIPGSGACKKCPENSSTRRIHSSSLKDCVTMCKPGFYSKKNYHRDQIMALEPCNPCEVGSYQPFSGKKQCLPCPSNTTTNDRGSIDINSCISTQEMCPSDFCFNGGHCIAESGGFSCDCPDDFIGSRCEKIRDPCESSPCLNQGSCSFSYRPLSYSCSCREGFRGRDCEEYIDECLSMPCKNNGSCISNESDFKCSCGENFAGEFCEIPLDLCFNVCEEGSTCIVTNDTWKCLCKPGFLGRRCQLVPCDWLPCYPNTICINIEEENATHESYRCECPIGYEGEDCKIKINHCRDSPCQNGGKCINNLSNYTCECSMIFDGLNCEEKLSPDFIFHFLKPGMTDYALLKGPRDNIIELTICLWLQSTDTFNYGTVFSYANQNHDNAITLTDYNGLMLYINGMRIVTDITLNDGFWHFLCVTWKSTQGSWSIYVDGILRDSGESLATGSSILGNGSIVIGQEQDDLQSRFSSSEAFVGRLTLLDMWNVTLSASLIQNLSETCEKYGGSLISWAGVKKHVFGDVRMVNSSFCHGCETPIAPVKGYVNVSDDFSTATYFCESGYNLKIGNRIGGSLRRRCLKQGQWEGHYGLIKCSKVICGYPGYFPRGRVHGSSFFFGDEIYYSCGEGYELRGNPHRVCNSDGSWSGRPPICVGITCKSLLAPEYGDIEYIIEEHERDDLTILQVGQQLEFKCNPGFRLIGEHILTCTRSGSWDYQIPFCQPLGCLSPMTIEHGHVYYHKNGSNNELLNDSLKDLYEYGEIVVFSCDEGYKFETNDSQKSFQNLQCSTNGSWIGSIANCTILRCPWPKIEHGRLENLMKTASEGFKSGGRLSIACEDGYLLSEDNVVCDNTGKWSPDLPECRRLHCLPPSSHPIASLFVTKPVIKARSSGVPNSESSDGLEHLTLAIEGDSFDDKLIVRCSEEKRVLNFRNSMINVSLPELSWRCNEKGLWESPEHLDLNDHELRSFLTSRDVCEGGKCPSPSIPLNAFVIDVKNNNDWKINESLTLKCRSGFTIQGLGTVFCGRNGSWMSFPTCKPVNCEDPPRIVSAEPEISKSNDSNAYIFGRIIQYSCSLGHRMFGQSSIRCLASGRWSRFQGKCSRISCGKPSIGEGVSLEGKSYLYQEILTVTCPGNFSKGTITCRADGTWSNLPICQ